jgi:hypothetical protein
VEKVSGMIEVREIGNKGETALGLLDTRHKHAANFSHKE